MAERAELEFTYSLIDRVFRISLGELADFSGAKYDGDFSLTLEEAQLRKHDYVAEQSRADRARGRMPRAGSGLWVGPAA
jgi:cyclopropane-fatty-acyl-phospholipid synthase